MINNFKDNPVAAAYVAMYEKQNTVDTEQVNRRPGERVNADDYTVTSEKSSVSGGHRAKVVHKAKGTLMYLSQHSYNSPKDAMAHASAYLSAYEKFGPNAAERAAFDFASKNKDKLAVKESVNELEEAFKAGDVVTVKNANKYDSLAKATVSGTVIGMNKSEVMVKVGTGQMNVDPKDLVKESVDELEEATDLTKVSTDKLQAMWNSHKDEERPSPALAAQLKRISAELAQRKKSNMKERADWVPEEISDEGVADFMGAAAAAAKKGDKTFKFGDKEYKVTMKKSTADAIDEQRVDEITADEMNKRIAAMAAVATEIEKYAKEKGGIDKADMLRVAMFLGKGNMKGAVDYAKTLDTDPRDFLLNKIATKVGK